MKRTLSFILVAAPLLLSQTPSGEAVLKKVDANLSSRNRVLTSTMIIHGRRDRRTLQARSWIQGTDKAFSEYLAPVREKGTKMLKLGDQLWMYSPTTDRIIQISGHMLRQSVMGSDLSYEDMMQDPELVNSYHAAVAGSERIEDRLCWVLTLKAKTKDMAYDSRKLWVDQERYVPLQEELYARSGKLLKRTELKELKKIGDRWYPTHILFKDMLKSGMGTEFIVDEVAFDQPMPEHIFSKAALK